MRQCSCSDTHGLFNSVTRCVWPQVKGCHGAAPASSPGVHLNKPKWTRVDVPGPYPGGCIYRGMGSADVMEQRSEKNRLERGVIPLKENRHHNHVISGYINTQP